MSTLVDFLLARFAEDEVLARTVLAINNDRDGLAAAFDGEVWMVSGMDNPVPGGEVSGARLLAEVEAKRQIVEWVSRAQEATAGGDPQAFHADEAAALSHPLRLLALPYAGHPDYPSGSEAPATSTALVATGVVTECCGTHWGGSTIGGCCDPDDCGPCCAECPTCPTVRRGAGEGCSP